MRTQVRSSGPLRRHIRQAYESTVQISWKDNRGQLKTITAKCLDISAEGVRLEASAPIPARTSVNLHAARYGALGGASVRHCTRSTLKYFIGVEFTSALPLAAPGRKRWLEEAQLLAVELPAGPA
jgi:hypothetical protein